MKCPSSIDVFTKKKKKIFHPRAQGRSLRRDGRWQSPENKEVRCEIVPSLEDRKA